MLLKLRLFGPFDARDGEAALPGLSEHRKATQLLALLALHSGRELSNEWLTAQLWPDNVRLDNLAQAVVHVRRALGGSANRLIARGGKLRLDLENADVDIRRLGRAWEDRANGLAALHASVDILQGSLLQDWYDDWVLDARAQWAQTSSAVLNLLFEDCMSSGDLRRARQMVRQIRGQGDSAESLHIQVMEALKDTGESASAKEFYEEYRDFLALRRGMLPPLRMQELYVSLPRMAPGFAAEYHSSLLMLEAIGGGMKLDSPFYVTRPADGRFHAALGRFDNIVCLRGPRQIGKTSLLARGLVRVREAGARVVVTDFQSLSPSDMASEESFYAAMARRIASQLKIDLPNVASGPFTTVGAAFQTFLEQDILEALSCRLVWAIDEADSIFQHPYATNVFSSIRARFNAISLSPDEPWQRLTTILTYSTEAHLFIRNVNLSPFNVGERIELSDFTIDDIASLNERYAEPLHGGDEIKRLYDLVGGHPYLIRYALHEMKTRALGIDAIESGANEPERFFGDHIHRILSAVQCDDGLVSAVRALIRGGTTADETAFERLRMAGVIVGSRVGGYSFRCKLYESALSRCVS